MHRVRLLLVLTLLVLLLAIATPTWAQSKITSSLIGPFSGSFTVDYSQHPGDPCSPQTDNVTFTGNVHVEATVDTEQNTVDFHINLLSVKGTGTIVPPSPITPPNPIKYAVSGAFDLLDETASPTPPPIKVMANLYPGDPCRQGFNSQGAVPVTITLSFDPSWNLNAVSASTG